MQHNSRISIIVTYLPVNEEVFYLTEQCLKRIKDNTFYNFELIKVNNGYVASGVEDITINNRSNLGNARAWDEGIGASSGDIIILMDNDVWVEKNWDKEMVDKLSDSQNGITFPYSIVGDEYDKLHSGFDVNYRRRRDGFCFAFRKETYKLAGPFLQDQPFHSYYEDDNFEANVQYKMGLKLVACPGSRCWHKGQGTTKKMWSKEIEDGIEANKKWYESKWDKYPYIED